MFWTLLTFLSFVQNRLIFPVRVMVMVLAVIVNFRISQSSVATYLRWGGKCHHSYSVTFLGNLPVKEFWKLVNISRSYDQKTKWLLFSGTLCMAAAHNKKYLRGTILWRIIRCFTTKCSRVILNAHFESDNLGKGPMTFWHRVKKDAWDKKLGTSRSSSNRLHWYWQSLPIKAFNWRSFFWTQLRARYLQQNAAFTNCGCFRIVSKFNRFQTLRHWHIAVHSRCELLTCAYDLPVATRTFNRIHVPRK